MVKDYITKGLMGFIAGYLLYKSVLLCIPIAALFLIYAFFNKSGMKERQSSLMAIGFRDFLICLEPILRTSENFSTAFNAAVVDYEKMHGDDLLLPILKSGTARFRINDREGDVLHHIAALTDIEDAYLFAGSLESSEVTGISTIDITGHTLGIITEKIRMRNELMLLLSGKRFEHILVSVIPAVILVVLSAGADSYLSPLYETGAGRGVMTAAGIIFSASWYAGKIITAIEV